MKNRAATHQLSSSQAFTLVELVVVIGLTAALLVSMAPALARQHPQSKAARCIGNLRTLMSAFAMYTQDNSELMPPNPDDGNTVIGHKWCPGLAGERMIEEYDPDALRDKSRNALASYLLDDVSVYACAADSRPSRPATGLSATNLLYRDKLLRPARSIAMSGAVGTICSAFHNGSGHAGRPVLPVDGPWLSSSYGHRAGMPYRTYAKLNLTVPAPDKLWVLIEEDRRSLNDATFNFGMNVEAWVDWPGINHEYAATVSFADGHAELHRWTDPRTGHLSNFIVPAPGSRDYHWLAERTSAKAQ